MGNASREQVYALLQSYNAMLRMAIPTDPGVNTIVTVARVGLNLLRFNYS